MADDLTFVSEFVDSDLSCTFFEASARDIPVNVKVCFVSFEDISVLSKALADQVIDTGWINKMVPEVQRSYVRTVKRTVDHLVEIFRDAQQSGGVKSEFGELMVSMGSGAALEKLLKHVALPISEIWKPQVRQNEGFDFHTICKSDLINFGEAKFSSSSNPHGDAISQAARFVSEEKHIMDRIQLVNIVENQSAINNLDQDQYGIVVAFSIVSQNPIPILKNAIVSAEEVFKNIPARAIYIVGVKG